MDVTEGEVTWPRILAAIDSTVARLSHRVESLEASSCQGGTCGGGSAGDNTNTSNDSLAAAAAAAAKKTTTSPKGDVESRLATLETRLSGMEAQFEDIAQREEEYLSGRYDCDALAESLKDLFVAVHREADTRQKQIACLDLRLSQRWQHAEALQHQMGALEDRVGPMLDDGLPKLQWLTDRIEECDGDVKNVRLASERALAEFTERMAELERSVCSVSVDSPKELPSTNGLVNPQQHSMLRSGSGGSAGPAEEKAFTGGSSNTQAMLTGHALVSVGGESIPDVPREVVHDEAGQDDHGGGNAGKTHNELGKVSQSHCSSSSTAAVSFSATSITSSGTPRTALEVPSPHGRVRRLVRQFTDGAGAAAHCNGVAGARVVTTKTQVESLDVTS
mmetsp:Transcript_56335/g.108690  ORF Transcript_56335/g.108690 Transcript_56335/m.108690 type:complete len:391 (-) Transcript_56335:320-1492(-)